MKKTGENTSWSTSVPDSGDQNHLSVAQNYSLFSPGRSRGKIETLEEKEQKKRIRQEKNKTHARKYRVNQKNKIAEMNERHAHLLVEIPTQETKYQELIDKIKRLERDLRLTDVYEDHLDLPGTNSTDQISREDSVKLDESQSNTKPELVVAATPSASHGSGDALERARDRKRKWAVKFRKTEKEKLENLEKSRSSLEERNRILESNIEKLTPRYSQLLAMKKAQLPPRVAGLEVEEDSSDDEGYDSGPHLDGL
jgi:hypothetical protein